MMHSMHSEGPTGPMADVMLAATARGGRSTVAAATYDMDDGIAQLACAWAYEDEEEGADGEDTTALPCVASPGLPLPSSHTPGPNSSISSAQGALTWLPNVLSPSPVPQLPTTPDLVSQPTQHAQHARHLATPATQQRTLLAQHADPPQHAQHALQTQPVQKQQQVRTRKRSTPFIDPLMPSGRRKCTAKRNKDMADVLAQQVVALLTAERALSAQNNVLAVRARVLQGLMELREERTTLVIRAQRLLAAQLQVAGTRAPAGPVQLQQAALINAQPVAPYRTSSALSFSHSSPAYPPSPPLSRPPRSSSSGSAVGVTRALAYANSTMAPTSLPPLAGSSSGLLSSPSAAALGVPGMRPAAARSSGFGTNEGWIQSSSTTASGLNPSSGPSSPSFWPPRPSSISDDTLLFASSLTADSLSRRVGTVLPTLASLLAAYQLAPEDPLSNILEKKAVAAAAADAPPAGTCTAGQTWPFTGMERTLLGLRAAARNAGLDADTMPPRAAAFEALLEFLSGQLCPVMRATGALQPTLIWRSMDRHMETGERLHRLPDEGAWAALAAKLCLSDEQKFQIVMVLAQMEVQLGRLRAERQALADSMAAAEASSSATMALLASSHTADDAGGFTAPITESAAAGYSVMRQLGALLEREAFILSCSTAYMFLRVFTAQQAVMVFVDPWPYFGNPLAVALAVRDSVAAAAPHVLEVLSAVEQPVPGLQLHA